MEYFISSLVAIALVFLLVWVSKERRSFNDFKKAKMKEFDFEEADIYRD